MYCCKAPRRHAPFRTPKPQALPVFHTGLLPFYADGALRATRLRPHIFLIWAHRFGRETKGCATFSFHVLFIIPYFLSFFNHFLRKTCLKIGPVC